MYPPEKRFPFASKELLISDTTYLKAFLANYDNPDSRSAALQSAGHYLEEIIATEKGVQWNEDILRPFTRAMTEMGILNPTIPIERNTQSSLGLTYIGFEVGNPDKLQIVHADILKQLEADGFLGYMDLRIEPVIRLEHRKQLTTYTEEMLRYGMSLRQNGDSKPLRIRPL